MRRSWLVQRLRKPRGGESMLGKDNPFAFGGGLRNGGLSDDAMDLLRGVFSFDYMGAAEFEFGAVPKALQSLAAAVSGLAAGSFAIPLTKVAPPFLQRKAAVPSGDGVIYWLARRDDAAEVEQRIRLWAAEGFRAHLKESTGLDRTLRPADEWDGQTVGWLELDNGFMFFADREMWEQSCALFGVPISEAVT